jgi:hypothetical protein
MGYQHRSRCLNSVTMRVGDWPPFLEGIKGRKHYVRVAQERPRPGRRWLLKY